MARGPLAGASGPGKFSKRTDMNLDSTSYGEGQETAMLSTGAPKATTRGVADNVGGRPSNPVAQTPITPLYAPTQKPEIPITEGIDMGDGAGSEALQMRQPDDENFRSAIASYMPVLAYISDLPNTSPETRQAIRQLRDQL
jgi:hypothetical protein